MTSQQQTYHTSSQKPEYTRENHRPVTSQQQTCHTLSQKTTDLWQVNNKLITPYHRKLQTCDKSTTNLSHLITENYTCDKSTTNFSHLITETRVHQRKPDLWQVNNKLITPYHRKLQNCNKSTTNLSYLITENYRPVTSQQQTYHTSSQKTTDLWQVNNKLITPYHRKLQTCDKSTTKLSHLITETRVHWIKPQTCDKSTINLSHLITENYRPVTSQQQTNHISSQKPEYTGENHRPVTSQQ